MNGLSPILVVDDDDDVREMLCMLLSAEGYSVLGAADGVEALERMRGEQPALVLLDLMMPRMDGESLVRQMTQDAALSSIPIAVMSGHTNARAAEWARPLAACLVKPIDFDEVLSVVEQFAHRAEPI